MIQINRDGQPVATVPEGELLAWFHRNTSQSMDWAIKHEGYSVEDAPPSYAAYVYTYDDERAGTGPTTNALRFRTSEEANAYASDLAGRWLVVARYEVRPTDDPVNYAWQGGQLVREETS